jgi:hypothetical protein
MDRELTREFLDRLDKIEKRLGKIAEALSVFKVMMMALVIGYLIVFVGTYLVGK